MGLRTTKQCKDMSEEELRELVEEFVRKNQSLNEN